MVHSAGTTAGERRLNGPQTSGREYRNLSEPTHEMVRDDDVALTMRDGTVLLAEVHRPAEPGRYPVLVAASCYPRQIQDLGAPVGFIESGASDFFVPRGYVHVVVNLRGTGGSGGEFDIMSATERCDLHDIVEWAGVQVWSDGNVGMVGISYFAMAQLEAAVEHPAHLVAIFPVAVSADLFELCWHHGLFNASFLEAWLPAVGGMSQHGAELWRGTFLDAARKVLNAPRMHARMEHVNGEATLKVIKKVARMHYPRRFDDVFEQLAIDHPVRDSYWDERDLRPRLGDITIPVYLGCDWDNAPVHLPSTFDCWELLADNPNVRMTLLGSGGLTWPWESLHVEALAWFDHWLKNADTGILDGDPVRWWMPGADAWFHAETWPPPTAVHQELALRADGGLAAEEGSAGTRAFLTLPTGTLPRDANPPTLLEQLSWQTQPLDEPIDMAGDLELLLDATTSALDTAWIAVLYDVAPDDTATAVTIGWLRASLRAVDEDRSRPGAPAIDGRVPNVVPPNESLHYRLPLVPNARRFAAGHRLRLVLASDDAREGAPTVLDFTHRGPALPARNTIASSSRLLIPVLPGIGARSAGG